MKLSNILIWVNSIALIYLLSKEDRKHHRQKTDLIFTEYLNNSSSKIKLLTMGLPIKQWLDANITLVDHETQQPISASFSNINQTSSDPSIFTADTDVNSDSYNDIVGIAEGTGLLTVEADATYIDSNTNQEVTAHKTATIDVEVTAAPPDAEATDLVITLSNPQVVPNP